MADFQAGRIAELEYRDKPRPGVAVVGRTGALFAVTPEDAAGYAAPPGFPAHGRGPSVGALGQHWAALLGD